MSLLSYAQVEEAITLNVAGGLTLENPLILRFVEAVVSSLPPFTVWIDLYVTAFPMCLLGNNINLTSDRSGQVMQLWDFLKLLLKNSFRKLFSQFQI